MLNISEADFQDQIIELAHLCDWTVAHFRPAMKSDGSWRTAVQADGTGFPDLVLVRERVIFAEIKTEQGQPSPEQYCWLLGLKEAGQEVYLWQPSDWEEVVEVLAKPGRIR